MVTPLRVLMVEDSEDDMILMVHELLEKGYDLTYKRVETAETMKDALDTQQWDVILSDFSMPNFSAHGALKVAREKDMNIPFIIVSGTVGEEAAVAALKAGAQDFFSKQKLTLLVPAIERELREADERRKRRWAEEQLRQSEERFAKAFQAGAIGISITSADGVFLDVNDYFLQLSGYSRNDVIGHTSHELGLWVDSTTRTNIIKAVTERQTIRDREFRVHTRSGELRDVLGSFASIDLAGQACVLSMLHDITERKRMEEKLHYDATLLRNVSDAVISTDMEGRIRSWNQGAETIYGWKADEVADRLNIGILRTQYPVGSEEDVWKNFYEGGEWTGEVIQSRKDGTPVYILASVSFVTDASGERIARVAVNRDITERKQAEEERSRLQAQEQAAAQKLFHTLERITDGFVTLDTQWHPTYVNPKAGEILGRKPEDLIGKNVWEEFPEAVEGPYYNAFQEATAQQISVEVEAYFEPWQRWFVNRIYPSPDGVTVFFQDTTESKRAEQEILEAERLRVEVEKERELIELKERFISIVSHEFRTPLAVIMSSGELVQRYGDRMSPEKQHEHIGEIIAQAGYMTSLLDDILTFSKASARKMEFKPAPLDLKAFCLSAVERIESTDKGKHPFKFVAEGDLENLLLDQKLLQHIVTNLLSNAVKYSPKGGEVRLELSRRGDELSLRVSDQGIGIPPEALTRLFEPFHRAENVGNISGTGLGLAIVKESVELHGGTIECDSEVGSGTTFKVRLPWQPGRPVDR